MMYRRGGKTVKLWQSLLLLSMVGWIPAAGVAQTGKRDVAQEQSTFSAEEESFQRRAQLPKELLRILRSDEQVLRTLKWEGMAPEELPADWFLASEIHLHTPDQADLIVMGVGPLRGANMNSFWVFRKTPHGYELVLTEATHTLQILSARSKGYRSIRSFSATAVTGFITEFRFDGRLYQVSSSKSKPI
jgi:hypothetical protein